MAFGGRVAVVTGAGSGMGQLATWRLASQGTAVAAVDVDEAGLERTSARAPQIRPLRCDVTDPGALDAAVREVVSDLGPIERVMHAAAIAPSGLLLEQEPDEIHRLMSVNYGGTVNVTRATLPAMVERGGGDFVLFASLAGWLPAPHVGAYCATKAAVVSFAETLFHENQRSGVRFACVCPPMVDTPMRAQVTTQPKWLEATKAIRPEVVLDAVEEALEAGRFLVFPDSSTAIVWRMRRFLPAVLWKRLDELEGLR